MGKQFTLGVLAGMGPRSTAPFLNQVLGSCEQLYGAKWDRDYPHMVIYSLPTPFHPERSFAAEEMIDCLRTGIGVLVKAGVDVIAVPCNTVHAYYEEMRQASPVPVLHIVDETVNRLSDEGSTAALLATRFTIESELYQRKILARNKRLFWNPDYQTQVDQLILSFKSEGLSASTLARWAEIEKLLLQNGVAEAIVACTDLSFCSGQQGGALRIYDSAAILAERLVRDYMEHTGLSAPGILL